ncbi:hypothetical protein GBAR_LOCUS8634, partial [Geodia barretti]
LPPPLTSPPTLPQLLRLKIPQRVGANYSAFGILRESSRQPRGTVQQETREDSSVDSLGVARGEGVEPVTWETLIKTLRDCDLSALADEVHQKLPSSHS